MNPHPRIVAIAFDLASGVAAFVNGQPVWLAALPEKTESGVRGITRWQSGGRQRFNAARTGRFNRVSLEVAGNGVGVVLGIQVTCSSTLDRLHYPAEWT